MRLSRADRNPRIGRASAGGRFGSGRAAGRGEAEGGNQCDEQCGADERRVSSTWLIGSRGYVEKIGCFHKSSHKEMAAWAERKVQVLAPARFENAMRPTVIFFEHVGNVSARWRSQCPPRRETADAQTLSSPEALMAGRAWHAKPRRGGCPRRGSLPEIPNANIVSAPPRRAHGGRLTRPVEDISVSLHDDARGEELSRRAWSGEEP
jgi:hypothetical protein